MEFVNHLGLSHLTLEPIVIAFFNWVNDPSRLQNRKNRNIIKLLEPHMHRTLAINFLAKHTLISTKNPIKNAVTDDYFSMGMIKTSTVENT